MRVEPARASTTIHVSLSSDAPGARYGGLKSQL